MKKQLLFIRRILLIDIFSSSIFFKVNAQQKQLKHELLVYILPDSLELSDSDKGNVGHNQAKILSKSLKLALDKVKPLGIGKAFPEWSKADSIKTREDGEKIKVPEFDRIFTLTFKNEEEANAAIEILKRSKAVLFAEKHSNPVLFNDPNYINGEQWHLNNDGRNGGALRADIHAQEAWMSGQLFT